MIAGCLGRLCLLDFGLLGFGLCQLLTRINMIWLAVHTFFRVVHGKMTRIECVHEIGSGKRSRGLRLACAIRRGHAKVMPRGKHATRHLG